MDPAVRAPVIVLVEGPSDAAVIRCLAARRGLEVAPGAVQIEPMGGVTNLGHHLRRHVGAGDRHVVGLYDAPDARVVARALRRMGEPVRAGEDLTRYGFFGCDRDLEDELLRALGPGAALAALDELGDLGRFRTFQGQPEWRGRELHVQLHRFAGSASGRKVALAERLAARLTAQTVPAPLVALLERLEA